ncbi:MAG: NAD(P)H-dependent glycerol-3-phosphate dehydrogenase [Candidatus Porifericomitaceae bacterium WSBS_2022_MAG_OTU9]
MADSKRVLVVGAGAWGTALAIVLARNGLHVDLWGRNAEQQQRIQTDRENKSYLPGIKFPDGLTAIEHLTDKMDMVVVAVPSVALRPVLQWLEDKIAPTANICLACKGLERASLSMLHEVVEQCLPRCSTALIGGPSFASEVAREGPTGVAIAAAKSETAKPWVNLFHSNKFRVYENNDITGVGVAGAVKNVIAIATGISDGLKLGGNSQAVLITRGLAEMSRIGVALGGKPETFIGLTGVGDLVLTCTYDESRNRRLGRLIVECGGAEAAKQKLAATTEGADTAAPLAALAQRVGVSMPISEQVLAILKGEVTPHKAMENLLSRPPRKEHW